MGTTNLFLGLDTLVRRGCTGHLVGRTFHASRAEVSKPWNLQILFWPWTRKQISTKKKVKQSILFILKFMHFLINFLSRYKVISAERFNYEQCMVLDCNYQPIYFFPKNDIRTLNLAAEKVVSFLMCLKWTISDNEILTTWLRSAIHRSV